MTLELTKSYPRLWSLEAGLAMIVTDLHGDWQAYQRYRDRFVDLEARGQADYLILAGDLIHAGKPETDQSVRLILDVLNLQDMYGSAIIYLCGNHELPHIYGLSLTKGKKEYTAGFEKALGNNSFRSRVKTLLASLPFYIRTKAGVSLAHAGAPAAIAQPANALKLFNWSHQEILSWVDTMLENENLAALHRGYAKLYGGNASYEELANHYLATSGPDDPRYNDLLRGFVANSHPLFDDLLWPALFTVCENEYGLADYAIFLDALLKALSTGFFPQQFLVSGHIKVPGGYQVIAQRQLRLASAEHATPRQAGHYLLLDTAQPIKNIRELLSRLGSVYR